MTRRARFAEWRYRHLFLLCLTLLVVLFELLLVYHVRRSYVVDVGSPGDGAFLTGFWADEADTGFRYRWSKDYSEITFLGAGSARPTDIAVRMQGPNLPGQTQPLNVTLSLNGLPLNPDHITVSGTIQRLQLQCPPADLSPLYTRPHFYHIHRTGRRSNPRRESGLRRDQAGGQWP